MKTSLDALSHAPTQLASAIRQTHHSELTVYVFDANYAFYTTCHTINKIEKNH